MRIKGAVRGKEESDRKKQHIIYVRKKKARRRKIITKRNETKGKGKEKKKSASQQVWMGCHRPYQVPELSMSVKYAEKVARTRAQDAAHTHTYAHTHTHTHTHTHRHRHTHIHRQTHTHRHHVQAMRGKDTSKHVANQLAVQPSCNTFRRVTHEYITDRRNSTNASCVVCVCTAAGTDLRDGGILSEVTTTASWHSLRDSAVNPGYNTAARAAAVSPTDRRKKVCMGEEKGGKKEWERERKNRRGRGKQ